jgi:hypothetical protein
MLNTEVNYAILLAALLALVLAAPVTSAQETGENIEDFEANSFEVFIGATLHDGDSEASYGASYQRRIGKAFGIGGLVEYTTGREWIFAVPFSWHITESWKLLVAPGFEHEEGENIYMTRIGTAYEFKFTGWSLAPEVNVDFVDGEVKTILGVSVGWEF